MPREPYPLRARPRKEETTDAGRFPGSSAPRHRDRGDLDRIAEVWDVRWEKKEGWVRVHSPRAFYAQAGELDLLPPWERLKRQPAEAPGTDARAPAGEPRQVGQLK